MYSAVTAVRIRGHKPAVYSICRIIIVIMCLRAISDVGFSTLECLSYSDNMMTIQAREGEKRREGKKKREGGRGVPARRSVVEGYSVRAA